MMWLDFSIMISLAALPILLLILLVVSVHDIKEVPIVNLLMTFLLGMTSVLIVVKLFALLRLLHIPYREHEFVLAFVSSGLIEEGVKYVLFYFFIWRGGFIVERYDAVLYAVFLALGFAFVENVLYLYQNQTELLATAYNRMVWASPAHFLFAVVMGYYFSLARFKPNHHGLYLLLAFVMPFLLHGSYNYILLMYEQVLNSSLSLSLLWLTIFYIFVLFLWYVAWVRLKRLSGIDHQKRLGHIHNSAAD